MKIGLNLLAILNLLGAAHGFLLALALLSIKRGNKTANRLLAAIVLTISIVVTGAALVTSNYVFVYPHLSMLHQPFAFLGGPLIYLYIRTLISNQAVTRKDAVHFIPFTLCVLYLLPYYLQGRAAKLTALYAEFNQTTQGSWYYARSSAFVVQVLFYLILIVALLIAYSRRASAGERELNKLNLFKVRFVAIGAAVLWIGAIVRLVFDDTSDTNLLVPLGASLLAYAMGYLEILKPDAPTLIKSPAVRKYEKSKLTPERSQKYLRKLLDFMATEKRYLDGDLTIQKLADELGIPAHYLSQTINEQLRQSFSEFLNSYRIEEAKRRLRDPAFKHLSILGIAEDVGFNSKSSFNAVFKKHTNLTPSEFRNQYDVTADWDHPRTSTNVTANS